MAVVEKYEADNGHNQDVLTGIETASEDLPEIGTWGEKEDNVEVKFVEALTSNEFARYS